jgi:hypothetical protein
VALSSSEAEYVAISSAAQDASWLTGFLEELGYHGGVPVLETDSASAKALASKDTFSKRTRHIAIRYHYIKDAVNKGELQLQWRKGKDNRADILTKLLPGPALTNERLKWSSGNWASELVEWNDVEN